MQTVKPDPSSARNIFPYTSCLLACETRPCEPSHVCACERPLGLAPQARCSNERERPFGRSWGSCLTGWIGNDVTGFPRGSGLWASPSGNRLPGPGTGWLDGSREAGCFCAPNPTTTDGSSLLHPIDSLPLSPTRVNSFVLFFLDNTHI